MKSFSDARIAVLTSPLAVLAALTGLATGFAPEARADWQLAPKNSHALYQSYGLYNEPQSQLLYQSAGRLWAGLGGSFALVGDPDSPAHPQLVLLASTQIVSMPGGGSRLAMDSLNVRLGAAYESAINPLMRLSLGVLHVSGHAVDGGVELDFASAFASGVEAHDTRLFGRFVYDLGPYVRAGATVGPVLGSDTPMESFFAQQFVEAHPWGGADDSRSPSPYAALGLEQEGTHQTGFKNALHAQIGVYLGNHFSNDPKPTLRAVAGFYTGFDPRVAYFRLAGRATTFGYTGLMFDF